MSTKNTTISQVLDHILKLTPGCKYTIRTYQEKLNREGYRIGDGSTRNFVNIILSTPGLDAYFNIHTNGTFSFCLNSELDLDEDDIEEYRDIIINTYLEGNIARAKGVKPSKPAVKPKNIVKPLFADSKEQKSTDVMCMDVINTVRAYMNTHGYKQLTVDLSKGFNFSVS